MFSKQKQANQGAGESAGSFINDDAVKVVSAMPLTSKIESVIGVTCRMNGILKSEGGLRIDGMFDGQIQLSGNLVVSETATVVAEIQAYNITVSGTIRGNITANKIEIMENGKVFGDLNVNTLLLNEGAFLRGNTNMLGDIEPPTLDPPTISPPRLVAPPPDTGLL